MAGILCVATGRLCCWMIKEINIEQIRTSISSKSLISYVAMTQRPGVLLFLALLEHTFFKPGTEDNDKLVVHVINWNNTRWVIITIPLIDKVKAEGCAKKSGLRVADGIPIMISNKGKESFPLDMDNVFCLENEKDSPVYKGITSADAMREAEMQLVDKIINEPIL